MIRTIHCEFKVLNGKETRKFKVQYELFPTTLTALGKLLSLMGEYSAVGRVGSSAGDGFVGGYGCSMSFDTVENMETHYAQMPSLLREYSFEEIS